MDYFWDSSDDDNDLEVVRDDGPEDSVVMEVVRDEGTGDIIEVETDADPHSDNIYDIEMRDSDNDSTSNLVMPVRKTKDPSPVWTCASRVEGGAKCRFCASIIKCTKASTSSLIHHLLKRHGNETAVKDLEKAIDDAHLEV